MAASASLFSPCALTSKLGVGHPSYGSRRRVQARRGRLSVVAVQTGPQKPSPPSSPQAGDESDALQNLLKREYKYGFVSDFESFSIPKGLSEATIRRISELKAEPAWMLDFRLAAYRRFLTMVEPTWSDNVYKPLDLQSICYYSAPKTKPKLNSLDEVDSELLKTFDRLGIPLSEQKRLANVAVDAVIDSTSIATTHRKALMAKGVIFCSISEAIREYPDLVRRHLGSIVPPGDNYYAALNSAVFSDGSFCYVPKDTVCPMEISTYFRINDKETGQFERTLIVADERSSVSYLEGCTAPSYDSNQLHAAVVELVCEEGAEIKYSTVQNWYSGDEEGNGGIYNFVTKRGRCKGRGSKISWTQVETGSAITWKYPSVEGRAITVDKAQPQGPGRDRNGDRDYDRERGSRYDRGRDYGGGGDGGRAPRGSGGGDCFKCGKPGHFARECPSGDGGKGDRYGGRDDRYGGSGRYGSDRGGDRYSGRSRDGGSYSGSGGDRYNRDRSGPY